MHCIHKGNRVPIVVAQDQLKTLLRYVRDVLGVESFAPVTGGALPPQMPQVVTAESKPYLFIGSGHDSASVEMQERMVGALKRNRSDFQFIDVEQTKVEPGDLQSASVVVIFGNAAKKAANLNDLTLGEQKSSGKTKFILTHSLADLAKSAPQKKETWTHLQSVF